MFRVHVCSESSSETSTLIYSVISECRNISGYIGWYIQEEIKSRLNSGNACYHSVQTLLSSRLL
jgi:hypothetical protein